MRKKKNIEKDADFILAGSGSARVVTERRWGTRSSGGRLVKGQPGDCLLQPLRQWNQHLSRPLPSDLGGQRARSSVIPKPDWGLV